MPPEFFRPHGDVVVGPLEPCTESLRKRRHGARRVHAFLHRDPAGYVVLTGEFLAGHRDEVLHQSSLMRQALAELEAAMRSGDAERLHALIDEASQTRSRWRLGGADSDV